jgi:hypothetical protein
MTSTMSAFWSAFSIEYGTPSRFTAGKASLKRSLSLNSKTASFFCSSVKLRKSLRALARTWSSAAAADMGRETQTAPAIKMTLNPNKMNFFMPASFACRISRVNREPE